ncbi:uncharacterized protein METZ01_LOCUS223298, partial [marine metagenome]
ELYRRRNREGKLHLRPGTSKHHRYSSRKTESL